ncbi:MAG: hypothetical protein R2867_08475 [Caldilineaceae bacterium]
MFEFVPLLSGIVLGLLIYQLQGRVTKGIVIVLLSLLIGYGVSALSGELALSWLYLVFDMSQTLFAAVVTQFLLARRQRHTAA